ncbi:MAG: SDR family NAD(P)-dependent oxidoreductase, partial [Nocardioidaceae bacterium]|nr:SDR family NAD(P)-dependent oxidoreductase [Nocardioidaceae bacterium]
YATARQVSTLADLGATVNKRALDVVDDESMRAVVDEIVDRHGAVNVLVNNAGYALQAPIETAVLDDIRRQFETNVFGLVRLTQLVLPGMRHRSAGRIINLSSMGGRFSLPGGGFYHATKHAVEAISDALRLEVASFGIRVSVVEPGPVLTDFGTTAVGTMREGDTAPGSDPYSDFMHRVAAAYAGAYDGGGSKVASSPGDVAAVIVKAATARRPRPRYVVGPVARVLVISKRVLPDRGFDALVRSQFPTP